MVRDTYTIEGRVRRWWGKSGIVKPRSIPISGSSIMTDLKVKWFICTLCLILLSSVWGGAQERVEDMGIMQQDEATLQWFRDAKFGMFLHWGLYAVEAKGEWYMDKVGIPIEDYRRYAFDRGDGVYFDANAYDPAEWARIAKECGMKYMCLTARHHEGFALFGSKHHNAFTSIQTLNRDLFREYVDACREAGLRTGIYYSPLSWRYPGYFDVTGENCRPNHWGYVTASWHKANARVMKEEVYEQIRTLFKNYGPFDYMYWDGAWLAYKPSDRQAAFFWEPGKYRDPNNAWPVDSVYADYDESGKPLGLMGIARKYSPKMVCNNRSGWIGDYYVNEGSNEVTGPIRSNVWEKNLNLNETAWGYTTEQKLMPYKRLIGLFVNCLVRNGNFLLNFGPDRYGNLPPSHVARLREMGEWLKIVGDGVYGTRGGPWHPKDQEYGFTMKDKKVFIHLLPEYQGTSFVTEPLPCNVMTCKDLYTGKPQTFKQTQEGKVKITEIDREAHPADTIIALTLDKDPPKPKHIDVPRSVIENKGL